MSSRRNRRRRPESGQYGTPNSRTRFTNLSRSRCPRSCIASRWVSVGPPCGARPAAARSAQAVQRGQPPMPTAIHRRRYTCRQMKRPSGARQQNAPPGQGGSVADSLAVARRTGFLTGLWHDARCVDAPPPPLDVAGPHPISLSACFEVALRAIVPAYRWEVHVVTPRPGREPSLANLGGRRPTRCLPPSPTASPVT